LDIPQHKGGEQDFFASEIRIRQRLRRDKFRLRHRLCRDKLALFGFELALFLQIAHFNIFS
jgi:hypothetical protein